MTPSEFFTAHGDNLAAAHADIKTIDPQAFVTAARDNTSGADVTNWANLTQRLMVARARIA